MEAMMTMEVEAVVVGNDGGGRSEGEDVRGGGGEDVGGGESGRRCQLRSPTMTIVETAVVDNGLVTPLQLPVKQTQNLNTNRHTFNKPFKCHCCKIFSSADKFKNSDNKTTRKCKSLKRYFFPIENGCASKPKDKNLTTIQSDLFKQPNAFYRFSRPHTVIGTLIGITSISILPLESTADLSLAFLVGLLKALVPSILMNLYVVGTNQLFDVDIDKVNKPNLPLASGEVSMEFGMAMVSTYLLMSCTMGIMFQSPPLFSALLVSFLLGSAYSVELPLLRWKRNAFLAAICILIVRAIVIQLAFFIHMQKYVLSRSVVFTKSLVFAIGFMCLFSTIIALFKDIPDVDGDREFGIQSFSVSLGPEKVFWLCISMLLIAYGAAMVIGASSSFLTTKLVTVLGHCALASFLWIQAGSVNLTSKTSITLFYMFIWKLFYAEYFLIPFVR